MLTATSLRTRVQELEAGDDASRRLLLQTLIEHEEKEWHSAPAQAVHLLVEALQRQLHNGTKQPFVLQQIVSLLGRMGSHSKPAVPDLIELLAGGTQEGLREASAKALANLGPLAASAVDRLVMVLADCRTSLAIHTVRALCNIGCADQRVRAAFIKFWLAHTYSHNQTSQAQVALTVCKLGIAVAGVELWLTKALVTTKDSAIRQVAAEALGYCDTEEIDVVPALVIATLHADDEKVVAVSNASLVKLGLSQADALRTCARQLVASAFAETALRSAGDMAVPALIEALKAEEPLIREKAARVLGHFGEKAAPAVPALTTALKDKNLDVRLSAAKGLWHTTKDAEMVVGVLVDLLKEDRTTAKDTSEARRRFIQTVIEALWRIGPAAHAATSVLIEKSKNPNRMISESAERALKAIVPAAPVKKPARQ